MVSLIIFAEGKNGETSPDAKSSNLLLPHQTILFDKYLSHFIGIRVAKFFQEI
jgi:hypothetical protein